MNSIQVIEGLILPRFDPFGMTRTVVLHDPPVRTPLIHKKRLTHSVLHPSMPLTSSSSDPQSLPSQPPNEGGFP